MCVVAYTSVKFTTNGTKNMVEIKSLARFPIPLIVVFYRVNSQIRSNHRSKSNASMTSTRKYPDRSLSRESWSTRSRFDPYGDGQGLDPRGAKALYPFQDYTYGTSSADLMPVNSQMLPRQGLVCAIYFKWLCGGNCFFFGHRSNFFLITEKN